MSVECIQWVMEHSTAKGVDRAVLLAIAYHASPDGTGAWPSIETIAQESGWSERAVHQAIKRLDGQHLEVSIGGGRTRSNAYCVLMEKGARGAPFVMGASPAPKEKGARGSIKGARGSIKGARGAPEPSLTVIEPLEKKNTKRAREVPETLLSFDSILKEQGNGHYNPSTAFYGKVLEKYGALDLEEEALKLTSWLQTDRAKKLKRTCNAAFILNWLKNAKEDRGGITRTDSQNANSRGASGAPSQRHGPGAISPFAKYGSLTLQD